MSAARLACSVEGPAGAPPIVLLHALATSRELWRPQLPAWATQFRVVRIDLPGHGESPQAEGTATLAGFADGVAGVLDGLDIQRAAFVGLSLGGMVAQAFALKYPQRCSALVLAHTSARTDTTVKAMWQGRLQQLEKEGLPAQAAAILGRWFPSAFAEASPMTLQWIASQIKATSPEGYACAIRAIQQLDHLDILKNIRVPTLVIAGEADMAAPPAAGALMAGQIANARMVVLPGVAHLGNVQAPVLFTETAGAFLQQALAP